MSLELHKFNKIKNNTFTLKSITFHVKDINLIKMVSKQSYITQLNYHNNDLLIYVIDDIYDGFPFPSHIIKIWHFSWQTHTWTRIHMMRTLLWMAVFYFEVCCICCNCSSYALSQSLADCNNDDWINGNATLNVLR